MSKTDAIKVQKGNIIAGFCAKIAQHCIDNGKLFSIENPTRSIIWEMIGMEKIIARGSVGTINFAVCMWGSGRDEKTSFLTNPKEPGSLQKECTHQKWSTGHGG